VCGVYFRWSVSHALYRLACKLLALFVLASPLREQGPSNRVRYETPSGVITGPTSLSRVVPSLQRAILSLQLTMTISQACYVYDSRSSGWHKGNRRAGTVYVHSTVYLAAHSSPLCVRFHTREAGNWYETVSYITLFLARSRFLTPLTSQSLLIKHILNPSTKTLITKHPLNPEANVLVPVLVGQAIHWHPRLIENSRDTRHNPEFTLYVVC
jgi:hypothetical protein